MEATQPHGTLGRARLSFADAAEIDEFVRTLERYENGELGPDQWRAFRLVRGTYGQRQSDASMLRVKIPQGILGPPQLHALADVASAHSRGFGHVTTRQNVQFHFIELSEVEAAMRTLAAVGLTTREACGNSVRNVTACPYAGVAQDELFDVTPYAEAFTRYFLRHPLSSTLPRKFKVAFEGCPEDHAFAAINDIGFFARLQDGRRGFRVTVGGGTAILCRSGAVLAEFLPAERILAEAEAILRVFARLGDYKHKQRNRMKFLIREIGFEAWKSELERELAAVSAEVEPRLPFDPETPPLERAPVAGRPSAPQLQETARRASASRVKGPGLVPRVRPQLVIQGGAFARWRASNARPQKQAGFASVTVTLPLGDVTAEQLRLVAELAQAHGDGSVRTTHEQNLLLRWVPLGELEPLYRRLAAAGLGSDGAGSAADPASCPGAETCRIAVTQSRGLGQLIAEHLRARPALAAASSRLSIKISGCPNGCGQHHVAGIGFQGSVRRLGGRVLPQYFVMLGGGVEGGQAHFGRTVAKVPARRVPQALERLIELYRAEAAPGESPAAFFRRVDPATAKALLADLEQLQPGDAQPADFVDLGEDAEYRAEVMEGECSA
jgi:sulfite reductase (NADPH) hemoprotein beta-component